MQPATKKADPLAQHLDALVDAHGLGVTDDEVSVLAALGEDIAALMLAAAEKLNGLTDGRMVTSWNGRLEVRRKATFDPAELTALAIDATLGALDAVGVVSTAAALRLADKPQVMARAA